MNTLLPIDSSGNNGYCCALPLRKFSRIVLRVALVACEAGIVSWVVPSISAVYIVVPIGIGALLYYATKKNDPFHSILQVIPFVRLTVKTVRVPETIKHVLVKQKYSASGKFARLSKDEFFHLLNFLDQEGVAKFDGLCRYSHQEIGQYYTRQFYRVKTILRSQPEILSEKIARDYEVRLFRRKHDECILGTIGNVICESDKLISEYYEDRESRDAHYTFIIKDRTTGREISRSDDLRFINKCYPLSEEEFVLVNVYASDTWAVCKVKLVEGQLSIVERLGIRLKKGSSIPTLRALDRIGDLLFLNENNMSLSYISLKEPLKRQLLVEGQVKERNYFTSNGRQIFSVTGSTLTAFAVRANQVVELWKRVWIEELLSRPIADRHCIVVPHKNGIEFLRADTGVTLFSQQNIEVEEKDAFFIQGSFAIHVTCIGSIYVWHIPLRKFIGLFSFESVINKDITIVRWYAKLSSNEIVGLKYVGIFKPVVVCLTAKKVVEDRKEGENE